VERSDIGTSDGLCPYFAAGYAAGLNGEYGQPSEDVRAGNRSHWHQGWDKGWKQRCTDIGEDKANALIQEVTKKRTAMMYGRA